VDILRSKNNCGTRCNTLLISRNRAVDQLKEQGFVLSCERTKARGSSTHDFHRARFVIEYPSVED
jgi:hypothetical protein